MRFAQLSLAALPILVTAHDVNKFARHANFGRSQAGQVTTSSTTTKSVTTSVAPQSSSTVIAKPTTSSPVNVPPASSVGTPSPTTTTVAATSASVPTTVLVSNTFPSVTFTLEATNPTAVPLSSIISGASSMPTQPLASTYAPGSIPTYLPGAPPLPNAALLEPANYPTLDKAPPTDSPEVQQWIADVAASGVTIPNIAPTLPGGCPANAAAAADTTRCWWTCGGCTRNTDITTCPDKLTWGLTYDDGPAYYTSELMSYLDQVNLKSTFFVVGSRVISFPATLQAQYMEQHQIAVHTWSHTALTQQTNEQIIAELGWSKKVIKDVLGVTPNIMRPPYGDIDDRVRAISVAMGLTPVIWTRISPLATFDTGDYGIAGGLVSVNEVLANWEQIIGNATTMSTGFIVLEHDLFQQTVEVATGYILPDGIARHLDIKPIVSCLNKPIADAYIETNDNKTNPPAASGGGAATLTPGAPGSAQATSKSGDIASIDFGMSGLLASFVGVVAGAGAILL